MLPVLCLKRQEYLQPISHYQYKWLKIEKLLLQMESASNWEDGLLWNSLHTSLSEDREWSQERFVLASEVWGQGQVGNLCSFHSALL